MGELIIPFVCIKMCTQKLNNRLMLFLYAQESEKMCAYYNDVHNKAGIK